MEGENANFSYETLWKYIIRPPRDEYTESMLGHKLFRFNKKKYQRKDYEIMSTQGYMLKCSFIEPLKDYRPSIEMPVVLYLHGNSSSRLEGLNMAEVLLSRDINLFVMDFAGCGLSEGEYISLGYHESDDVGNIINFLEKLPGVGNIGLWGRSMGAATSLIYTSMDKRIKATVADSPFGDFRKLAKEMVLNQIKVPGFLVEGAISIIGKSVKNRNGMNINEIKAIESVKKCEVPVIFIHARDDELVPYHHSEDLLNNYHGKIKELKSVNGGHNGRRPNTLMEYVGDFFAVHLDSGYKPGDSEKFNSFVSKILVKKSINNKEKEKEKEKENLEDGSKDQHSNSAENGDDDEAEIGDEEEKTKDLIKENGEKIKNEIKE